MKVLVLIIANDTYPYHIYQGLWEKYMINTTFECYFIKSNPNLETEYLLEENTLFIKLEESFYTILKKTQKALQFFNLSNYDYIFRTNLSSFIVFDKYKKWLEILPIEKVYNGSILWYGEFIYASGCGFTVTPDVAKIIMEYDGPLYTMDDITIGKICSDNDILVTSAPLSQIFEETYINEMNLFDSFDKAFHVRVKTDNRANDLSTYFNLVERYYKLNIETILS